MITAEEVRTAYQLMLQRDPSEAETKHQLATCGSVSDLRRDLIRAAEFQAQVPARGKPHDWPPMRVDVDVTEGQLGRMIERIERKFHYLGQSEPHWSVLSADRFLAANLDEEREQQFFDSGAGDLRLMQAGAARCGFDLGGLKTCFELGCGIGRTTRWLATQFQRVVGADISASHLALAREVMQRFDVQNVEFMHVNSVGALREIEPFDAFLSVIVLQHNPPPVIAHLLRTVLGKLNPGGVAYFQVPTYNFDYRFDAAAYLESEIVLGHAEMHFIPQHVVCRLVEEAGCSVLEVREDGGEGTSTNLSQRFLVHKKRPSRAARR